MTPGSFFSGSHGGDRHKLRDGDRLECRICWYVYDPAQGDPVWQVPAGTTFSHLPLHWTCPQCDGDQAGFLVIAKESV